MEFKSFGSLDNHYRESLIHQARAMGLENVLYLVTEKIHGANFSFHVNIVDSMAVEVKPANRSAFIEDTSAFYGCTLVVERYISQVKALAERFSYLHKKANAVVVVYGELYGGNVQRGMPYKKEKDFAAFDLTVDGVPVNKILLISACDSVGLPFVPVIGAKTSLTEALEVNEAFDSLFTHTDFNGENKEAEGIVIEPVSPEYFNSESRVYFKKKTKRFLEKGGNKIKKPKVILTEDLQGIFDEALEYVTENRFNSVVSKIGEVTIKDIGRVAGLMTQDLLEDMQKDGVENPDEAGSLLEVKHFMHALQKTVMDFIRPVLLAL